MSRVKMEVPWTKMRYQGRGGSIVPKASSLFRSTLSGFAFRRNTMSSSRFMQSFHRKSDHQLCFDPLGEAPVSAAVLSQIKQLPWRITGWITEEGSSEMQNKK